MGRALIDVEFGQLTIKAHDKVKVFDMYHSLELPFLYEELFIITIIDLVVESQYIAFEDPLKGFLVGHDIEEDTKSQEIASSLNFEISRTRRGRVELLDR